MNILNALDTLPPAPRVLTGDEALAALARSVASRARIEDVITHKRGGVAVDKSTGRSLYNIIGSYRQDKAQAWVPCSAEVVPAAPEDNCIVKCSNSEYKVGLSAGDWPVAWKERESGKVMRARPVAVTAFNDLTGADLDAGIVERAGAYGYDAGTGELAWGSHYVSLRLSVDAGGAACHNLLVKELVRDFPAKYYGVVWEFDDADLLRILHPGGGARMFWPKGTSLFVEYVEACAFDELGPDGIIPTGRLQDVEHDYTTIGGGAVANEIWNGSGTGPGCATWYFTSYHAMGVWTLSLVTSAGNDICLKSQKSTAYGIQINSTGTVIQSGAGNVHWTSSEDDTIGETIAGSGGVPAVSDHPGICFICNGTNATQLVLTRGSCRYTRATSITIVGWSAASNTRTISVSNWAFYNCDLGAGGSLASTFLGLGSAAAGTNNGAVTLSNIKIDSTNSCSTTSGRAVALSRIQQSSSVTGLSVTATGQFGYVLSLAPTVAGACTTTVKDVLIVGNVADAATAGAVYMQAGTVGLVHTCNFSNAVITNTGTGDGIMCYLSNGTLNANVINSILTACDGAAAVALNKNGAATVTHTYNVYYGNTSDCFEALTGTEQTGTDPQLGNLPAGCAIDTASCPFPNGYAVGNLTFEFDGSNTFDNLSIDETACTMTGWRYAGTKNVTPGIYYFLTTFPESFGTCVPNSGDTAGGTSVTVGGGVGWGAAQGTGEVTVDGTGVVEAGWSDAGCTFTTPAHAAGAVDVVCTNYRGAVITGAGAYTYTSAPPPPPPVTDSLEDLGTCSLLWREPPNWVDTPEQHTEQQREVLTIGSGTAEIYGYGDYQPRVIQYRYTAMDRSDLDTLMDWHAARQGRLQRFWLPLWRNEFVAAQAIVSLGTEVVVRWCGVAAAFQGYERIFILLTNGYWLTRHVSAVVDNGDGTETMTIVTPWDRDIALADIAYLGRLLLVRHDEDALELSHRTAAVAEATVGYHELVNEYDDIEPGS